jgi:endonuclease/exonuclease/phosphatase family metal-dependent hydrolase
VDARATDAGGDAGGGDAGTTDTLRVLTLNLHCLDASGTAYATNEERLAAVADFVAAEDVSVALLQEVCDGGALNALETLDSAIEARTGASWGSAFALAHIAWEGTPEAADEGVAILARGTLTELEETTHVAQGALRRVVIEATLDASLGGVRVASFHFDHLDASMRERQAGELAVMPLVGMGAGPHALLGGDLNDTEGSGAHAALLAAGFVDASADLPADRIDHLFVHRGAGVTATEAELVLSAPGERVSDHPGVLVILRRAEPAAVAVTHVVGHADVGFGHYMTIRGDTAPLSWDRGWPLLNVAADEWRFATTELTAAFAFKLLRDDDTWQTGADVAGTPGTTHDVTPAF